jgi:hypothetical protein
MSKPYQPTGTIYRFTIIKDSNVEIYIGTEKGIKAYQPDKIIKQALIHEHYTIPLRDTQQPIKNEIDLPKRQVKEIGANHEATHTRAMETHR